MLIKLFLNSIFLINENIYLFIYCYTIFNVNLRLNETISVIIVTSNINHVKNVQYKKIALAKNI